MSDAGSAVVTAADLANIAHYSQHLAPAVLQAASGAHGSSFNLFTGRCPTPGNDDSCTAIHLAALSAGSLAASCGVTVMLDMLPICNRMLEVNPLKYKPCNVILSHDLAFYFLWLGILGQLMAAAKTAAFLLFMLRQGERSRIVKLWPGGAGAGSVAWAENLRIVYGAVKM